MSVSDIDMILPIKNEPKNRPDDTTFSIMSGYLKLFWAGYLTIDTSTGFPSSNSELEIIEQLKELNVECFILLDDSYIACECSSIWCTFLKSINKPNCVQIFVKSKEDATTIKLWLNN